MNGLARPRGTSPRTARSTRSKARATLPSERSDGAAGAVDRGVDPPGRSPCGGGPHAGGRGAREALDDAAEGRRDRSRPSGRPESAPSSPRACREARGGESGPGGSRRRRPTARRRARGRCRRRDRCRPRRSRCGSSRRSRRAGGRTSRDPRPRSPPASRGAHRRARGDRPAGRPARGCRHRARPAVEDRRSSEIGGRGKSASGRPVTSPSAASEIVGVRTASVASRIGPPASRVASSVGREPAREECVEFGRPSVRPSSSPPTGRGRSGEVRRHASAERRRRACRRGRAGRRRRRPGRGRRRGGRCGRRRPEQGLVRGGPPGGGTSDGGQARQPALAVERERRRAGVEAAQDDGAPPRPARRRARARPRPRGAGRGSGCPSRCPIRWRRAASRSARGRPQPSPRT
jgi:hypothetical protein